MNIDEAVVDRKRRRHCLLILLSGVLGLCGCQPSAIPTTDATSDSAGTGEPPNQLKPATPAGLPIVTEEYFDQMLIDGHPVGYQMTQVAPVDRGGGTCRRI